MAQDNFCCDDQLAPQKKSPAPSKQQIVRYEAVTYGPLPMLTVGCWVVSCEVGWFGVLEVKVSRKSGKTRVEVCGWCPSFFPRDFLFGSKRPAGGQRQEKIIGCWGPCAPPAFLSLSEGDKVSISWYPLCAATANQIESIQTLFRRSKHEQ